MAVVADRAPSPPTAPALRREAEARPWASVRAGSDLAALEADWRALEADALVTPYQAYDWVRPFATTIGCAEGMEFRFVRVEDSQGGLLALFPLVITRRLGTRFAEFIGGKHANYHMALYRPGFAEAIDAAATGSLNSLKRSSTGTSSSRSTVSLARSMEKGGSLSCSTRSCEAISSPTTSGRVERTCPNLI